MGQAFAPCVVGGRTQAPLQQLRAGRERSVSSESGGGALAGRRWQRGGSEHQAIVVAVLPHGLAVRWQHGLVRAEYLCRCGAHGSNGSPPSGGGSPSRRSQDGRGLFMLLEVCSSLPTSSRLSSTSPSAVDVDEARAAARASCRTAESTTTSSCCRSCACLPMRSPTPGSRADPRRARVTRGGIQRT